jgi:SAM-dependent methyltransferase
MSNASRHYLGAAGVDYFKGRFGDVSEYGRVFQSLYFRPYCDETRRVLDFGCGDGTILRSLAAREKIGVEINPVCRDFIEQRNVSASPRIRVIDSLPNVPVNWADVGISNHSLEHVVNPLQILSDLHRALRPGGVLIVVTPYDDWRSHGHKTWVSSDKDHHLFTWSPLNLGNLLAEAGFQIVGTRISTQAWSPKLFFIGRYFGFKAFRIGCWLLGTLKNRREVVAVARKS